MAAVVVAVRVREHDVANRRARHAQRLEDLGRVEGRVDEMIKVSGNRLSPSEVEELAHECGWIDDAVACTKIS